MAAMDRAADEARDLVAELRTSHRAVESRIGPVLAGDGDPQQRLAELLAPVYRYGRILRDHLDPLVRRYLPDGPARADRHLAGYVDIELLLIDLRRHRPGQGCYAELLRCLIPALRAHLIEQDFALLPHVRWHVPPEVLRQRGRLARGTAAILTTMP